MARSLKEPWQRANTARKRPGEQVNWWEVPVVSEEEFKAALARVKSSFTINKPAKKLA